MTTVTGTTYSTVEAARIFRIPYGQLRWMIETGVITHAPVKAGQKRRFTDRDLWMIYLASKLKQAGIGIKTIKQAPLSDMSIQPYHNSGILYTHDEKKHQFAAYWDTSFWSVGTGLTGILELRKKAEESKNCIFFYNAWNAKQAKRIEAQMEAQDEQKSNP